MVAEGQKSIVCTIISQLSRETSLSSVQQFSLILKELMRRPFPFPRFLFRSDAKYYIQLRFTEIDAKLIGSKGLEVYSTPVGRGMSLLCQVWSSDELRSLVRKRLLASHFIYDIQYQLFESLANNSFSEKARGEHQLRIDIYNLNTAIQPLLLEF